MEKFPPGVRGEQRIAEALARGYALALRYFEAEVEDGFDWPEGMDVTAAISEWERSGKPGADTVVELRMELRESRLVHVEKPEMVVGAPDRIPRRQGNPSRT